MAKNASPSADLQVLESAETVAVQIPLPVLGALVDAKSALFDLCVGVGQQVLGELMECDREASAAQRGSTTASARRSARGVRARK